MAYKLTVTEHADELLEIVPQMAYIVVFSMKAEVVNVVGIFNLLKNYQRIEIILRRHYSETDYNRY